MTLTSAFGGKADIIRFTRGLAIMEAMEKITRTCAIFTGETMAELAREYECGEATIWRALQ